jgi:hypothetical protein
MPARTASPKFFIAMSLPDRGANNAEFTDGMKIRDAFNLVSLER